MNKTYKVIYNRTRCMYQVVSELAKGHTKSETPEMLKSLFSKHSGLTRGIVMAVLSMSLAMPVGMAVQAADTAVTVKDGAALVGNGAVSVSSTTSDDKNIITISVPTNGAVEASNTGLVTGGTVYSEVRPSTNGTYVKTAKTTSENLTALDTQVNTNTGDISGLKNMSNITTDGKKVIKTLVKDTVKVAQGNRVTVSSNTDDLTGAVTYTISANNDGEVAEGNTNLVSGGTVYTAIQSETQARMEKDAELTTKIGTMTKDGSYAKMANSVASNLTALDTQVGTNTLAITNLENLSNITDAGTTVIKKQAKQAVKVVATGNATVTTTGSADDGSTLTYTINVAHDGGIKTGDTNLVSGGTMYTELRPTSGKYISAGQSTAANLISLDQNLLNVVNALGLDADDTSKNYTSKLNKYFKVNPEITTNTDNKKTYAADAAANGTNSVAVGPNAKTATYTTTVTSGASTTTTETAADHAVAIGDGATVNAAGDKGIALGNGAVTGEAETTSTDGTSTTTTDAKGGVSSAAIGDSAVANGNEAIALGKGASVLNPSGTAVSTGSTAIGSGAKVDGGDNSIAFGTKATINKKASASIAIGKGAVTGGVDKPIVLTNGTTGTLAAAGGVDSIAIGNGSVSEGNEALALGNGAKVTNGYTGGDSAAAIVKTGSAAIGDGANVYNSTASMAIGEGASISEGENTTVIGSGANASQTKQAFVAGYQASADSSAESSVAIGDNASTHSARTTAIGYKAEAHYANSIAIGSEATTSDSGGGIAIGSNTSVAQGGIAIGKAANAQDISTLAIGDGAVANVNYSISIGYQAGLNTSEDYKERNGSLVAIGTSAGNNVKGMQNVAIGASAGSSVLSSNNISIGTNAGNGIKNVTSETDTNPQNGYNISIGAGANYTAGNTNQNIVSSIAIGHNTHAVNRAVALGEGASAQGDSGMALGNSATSSGSGSIAIGNTASASNGNIALGAGAIATGTPTGTGKWTNTVAPSYYISVGGKGNASDSTITLRRISNVADGSADQDVVTVKQLQKVSDDLENTIKGIDTSQLKTYSTTEIDNKIAEVNQNIKNSGVKYFSINSASQSTNSNNTGANGDGDADAMAIGPNAKASSVKALAIGNNVSASGTLSIAIGTASNPSTDTTTAETPHPTSSEGTSSVAIGTSAIAQTNDSIAIGTRAATYTANTTSTPVSTVGVQSIAIGFSAETRDDNAISIGTKSKANSVDSIAIGDGAEALNTSAVVIGKASTSEGSDSVTIGESNINNGKAVITTGNSNQITNKQRAKDAVQNSGVYGSSNVIKSVSSSNDSHAVTDVYAVGNNNTLNQNGVKNVLTDVSIMGNNNNIENGTAGAYTQTVKQIAVVGSGNKVKGNTDINTTTWGTVQRDTILGYKNTVDATNQSTPVSNLQILGNDVTATLGNSVYLGTGSSATASKSATAEAIKLAKDQGDTEAFASDEYKNAATDEAKNAIKQKYEAKYIHAANIAAMDKDGTSAGIINYDTDYTYGNDSAYTYAGSQATGIVTVGSEKATRRIQNVSAGLVGPDSTDAVNGSQLYALTRQIRFGGDNSVFGDTAAGDTNVVARGSNEKISITGGSDAVTSSTTDGKTTYTVDAAKLTGNNIAVVANTGTNALHVQLASNLKDLNTAQLGKTTATTTTAADGTESTTYSYQETLKLDGTGDNGGTLALEDASGKNGITLRTSGSTTTADVNGTATTRLLVNDKTVATTDDGLKFGGDTGTDSALKLNNKLNVKGGTTDTSKLTENNIGVVSDGNDTLTVKLNKNVNLGMDGSLTTGAVTATTVTADTVTSGNSTLNTNGLTITNGPSVLATGINAGSKKIANVSDGEANADAANYGQVKAAKTILTQGNNTQLSSTTADDGHQIYTVNVDNLSYKAGADTTARSVTLSNGLTFQNGKNTTAVAGDNGTITYNLNDKIELGSETDSNNHIVVDGTQGLLTLGMDATINGNAGTASIGGVSIGKSGTDRVITGLTNKTWTVGTTQAVDGRAATENQLQSVADNLNTANTNIATLQHGFKVQANGDTTTESTVKADDALNFTAGNNAKVTTTKDSKQITISVDNLSVKDNNGTAQSVKLADGLNFQDGTNTTAVVGANGSVTYDLKSSITLGTATDEANRIIVNGTNGTITVGKLATINGNAGTASIGGVSIGKSGSDQTVTGLSNTTWVVGTTKAVSGRAATENQLQSVSDAAHTNANNITTLQQGFTVTANGKTDTKSTVKAGETLNFQAGKNVQISTTADSKSIEVALSDTPEFTTVTAKDANGNITTVSGTGVTITPTGTGTQSVSLTSEGLDNGNHVIRNVASGGTERTNAANIGDLQDAISNASTTTTNIGFKVKGDDTTSQTVKLGKQLNVVGGTTDSTQLSAGNIGVVTTADTEGNATLTVKLNKNINLDSVKTDNTTLNTNGVSNGDMSLTNTGLVIKNNDASKQVSVTTSGVSMGSQRIQNVADAMSDTDAATLKQVKKARTVVTGGSNVASVTPSEGANNQVTYTVNVDNLSVKANKEASKSVALKNGLTFNNGTNTTASVSENGEVKYDLNSTLTGLTSVTAGNSTLDTNGLTIKDGAATKVEITSGNVTMGGNVIHNVGDGVAPTDAVNKGQLEALQNQVSVGWNLAGNNAEGTAVTAQIGAGKTVTYDNGNYTKAVVTKDDTTGNATVNVDVTTGAFGSGTGDKAGTVTATAKGLATTGDVANAINSASISVVADNTPENKTAVKAGDTIHFAKDDNLTLVQNGTTFTYGLNPEISISKVTTSDATKGSTVQTAEGITTKDAAGNTYEQTANGITLTPKTSGTGKTAVSLTNTGLNNGNNVISGVGAGSADTDAVNVSQLKKVQDQVGSGWQIAGNDGTKVADIGAGKKVAFKSNSRYLMTSTAAAASGETDTGADVTYSLKTKELASGTNGAVASVSDADDGLVTAKNVAETINQTYWSVASGKSGSGSQTDKTANAADKQISAGDMVTFNAGNNLSLVQNGASFTYGLQTDLTGMNTIRLGGTLNNGSWSGGLLIGNQAGSGANTAEGNYITGLSNTKWDRATISENSSMAATEGQLKQAIENITKSGDGTGGFGLTADSGEAIMQDLRKTIQIKGDGEGKADGNITTSNESGVLRIRLNKKLDLTDQGSVTIGSSKVSDGSIVLGNTDVNKKIALNSNEGTASIGSVTVNGTAKTVSGLSNTEWNVETAAANGYTGSNQAATESQLQTVYNQATKTASENELHTLAKEGGYTVDDNHQVSMDVVNGKGDKQGSIVINDVAKASEVGTVSEIADDLKKKNGDTVQPTSVVEAINNLNDKVGDKKYSTVQGKELADGDSATTAIGKLNNRMNDIYTTAGQHSSVSKADDNLTISENKNASGGTDYKIGLNKEQINLGNLIIKGNEGSISAKSMTSDSFTAGDTVVNKDGVKVGDKSALTGDSLKVNGKTYVDDKGVNANGQVIRNVGEGKEDGDAVNVKQVNDLAARQGEDIEQNTAHINQLGQAVNKLGNRLNRVGAGAAALAALHPGTYDPNDKWDFSAGIGHYHDANAVAIGAYYHPNDTTILSIGGSMGGGENMVNAGITWKMGRSGREQAAQPVVVRKAEAAPVAQAAAPVRPTPVVAPVPAVTPAPVKSVAPATPVHAVPAVTTPMTQVTTGDTAALAQILARQTAILEKLAQNQAQAVPSAAVAHGDDIFPDVPDNHWAYAYVAKLEKAGALKGFKRPAVLKSPMMTRDDFASVLYTAMANGATTNPALNGDDSLNRLAQEFKAELKNVKA